MALLSFPPLSFWYIQFWLVCNSALVVVLRGLVALLGCSSEQTHYLGWTGFIVRIWIYNSHLDLRLSPGFFYKTPDLRCFKQFFRPNCLHNANFRLF